MPVQSQVKNFITSLHQPKKSELETIHQLILLALPNCTLWFNDGKNVEGKIVANPNIGYGNYTIQYTDGTSKDFFKIGLSANTVGISVYILGLTDKTYLIKNYSEKLGKAKVTGYCIKFKKLNDINIDVLISAIKYGYNFAG
jgi:hypothetical protein